MGKLKIIVGIIWILIGIPFFYNGFSYLYTYSTPGVLWVIMMQIKLAYFEIISGILCLYFSLRTFKESDIRLTSLLILPVFMILYNILIFRAFVSYGSYIFYGFDNLLFITQIIIYLYLYFKTTTFQNKKITIKEILIKTGIIISLCLISYGLAEILPYRFYHFLH